MAEIPDAAVEAAQKAQSFVVPLRPAGRRYVAAGLQAAYPHLIEPFTAALTDALDLVERLHGHDEKLTSEEYYARRDRLRIAISALEQTHPVDEDCEGTGVIHEDGAVLRCPHCEGGSDG